MSGKPASSLPHLDDHTVDGLVDLAGVTDVVEAAFAAWGRGDAATTQRVRSDASGAMASAMAAVAPPYSGGKVYATKQGSFTFLIVLFDMDGRLLCTLDGAAETMVARARSSGIPAVAAPTATAAVADADVIVTATQSTTPLFTASAIGDRTLVCAVGSTKYDRCEIGPDVVERCATVVCDDVVGSRVECGDLIHAAATGRFDWARAIELRDVVAGAVDVERAGTAPVLFETQGVALQDVAAAGLAFERYTAKHSTQPTALFTSQTVPTVRKDAV